MRNKTAFIFVFFANIVLLAHAVIPHHHHQNFPLETYIDCNHNEGHKHHVNMPVCNHDHQHDKITACIIQAMLIPGEEIRGKYISEKNVANDMLFLALFVYNFSAHENLLGISLEIAESIPLYSQLLNSCLGLRAPPVC